ncbi:MAG: hypothetical protein R3B89_12240 [Polyangiaceae bacterium]
MRCRELVLCCVVCVACACAKKDEPPRPSQAPQSAPAQAAPGDQEPSDEEQRPESKAAEEPEAPGAGLPKSTRTPAPATGGELKQEKAKDAASFTDLASAERAFKTADLELTQLFGAAATALSEGDGRCTRACQAFASLQRAADGICRLAGDTDQRCTKARGRVKEHAARLQACSCE